MNNLETSIHTEINSIHTDIQTKLAEINTTHPNHTDRLETAAGLPRPNN